LNRTTKITETVRGRSLFQNKTILITGGTGSFGNKFTERLLQHDPKKIIIYSRDEYKQYIMAQKFDDPRIRFFIGDVRDKDRLYRACADVDYIIHAAALKHVPICEYNPIEAIRTNTIGAINVIDVAIDRGVKQVVALSTDKAVNPVNLYGATKLCSDKLFIAGNSYSQRGGTTFAVVRYGNVAHSRGSVIPLFEQMVKDGAKTLPVTHEDMTRFYITLDQGVDLVFKAFESMRGGEIFVAKIPSFKIVDLVRHLGCEPEIIGIRPGEKLHEVMITTEDARNTYEYDGHYIIYPAFSWWTNKHFHDGGVPVPDGFTYSSDQNTDWLYNAPL
jgi:UDP-N-acetylglucosamine 4,6-dehydratase/5-epimerase